MMIRPFLLIALVPVAAYALFICLLLNPWIQRQALYANNFHTSWWHDLDDPECWGFGKNQVTPFYIKTLDGHQLHAWHILPRALFAKHRKQLAEEDISSDNDFKGTLAYQLLKENPDSKVVINFHGNAGHLLQNQRPYVYRSFTSLDPATHVIAFSYRGFGRSAGVPSETGLITDGITAVNYTLSELDISPSSIALTAQSLGTAVLSGVAEYYCSTEAMAVELPFPPEARKRLDFATIVLVSPFSDLKTLLLKYRIGGYVPILSPLAWVPSLQTLLTSSVQEPWESKTRIANVVAGAVRDIEAGNRDRRTHIQLVHAVDDPDIPYENSERIYDVARTKAYSVAESIHGTAKPSTVTEDVTPREMQLAWGEPWALKLSMKIVRKGGHNEVAANSVVAAAVMDGLGIL